MPVCPHCGSESIIRRGYTSTKKVRIQCRYCDLYSSVYDDEPRPSRSARILLLDIETLPGEFYAFDPKVDYLSPDKMIKDWSISCFAAKWLFEPEILGKVVTAQEAFDRTETSILGDVWRLMSEADIIVTQNGINFDIKKLNTKFLIHRYAPPSKYLNVDTLKVAQSVFGFNYNRLNELGKQLGIGEKTEMDFQDWKNCLTNDKSAEKALAHKLEYCKRDVAPLLEDVYVYFLPWINNHPNLNLFTNHDKDVCPKCESDDLRWGEKYTTPQGLWKGFRCNSCGAIGRGKGKEHKIKAVNVTN